MCKYCGDGRHTLKHPLSLREQRFIKFLEEDDVVIKNGDSKEPALLVGTSVGTISGLVFVLQYFFPDLLTAQQTELVLVLAAFVLPWLTAIITRRFVWSPNSVQELLDKSIQDAKDKMQSRIQGEKATGTSFDDKPNYTLPKKIEYPNPPTI